MVGRPVDPNLKFVGHLAQRTMLVRGDNNRDVWGHDADRMAAAVIDESAVPDRDRGSPRRRSSRQGSKNLKVVAKRKEGFTQPIALRLLYDPPGIGSSGSISIPGDKNEALIPLTANGSAAIGTWPIVVIGTATVGNGPIEVATPDGDADRRRLVLHLQVREGGGRTWGKQAELVVNVEKKTDFAGEAEVQAAGPARQYLDQAGAAEDHQGLDAVGVPDHDRADRRPGTYKGLVCQAVDAAGRRTDHAHPGRAANCAWTPRCRRKPRRPRRRQAAAAPKPARRAGRQSRNAQPPGKTALEKTPDK